MNRSTARVKKECRRPNDSSIFGIRAVKPSIPLTRIVTAKTTITCIESITRFIANTFCSGSSTLLCCIKGGRCILQRIFLIYNTSLARHFGGLSRPRLSTSFLLHHLIRFARKLRQRQRQMQMQMQRQMQMQMQMQMQRQRQ